MAASAYPPGGLARAWSETAASVCRAARPCPAVTVATQGYVLCPADFTATLAVETAVHYLELTASLPSAPPPDPASLALVRRVLDGLLGSPLPASWDDASAAVKSTGRTPLSRSRSGGPTRLQPVIERFWRPRKPGAIARRSSV